MESDCPFCRIVRGETDAYRVFEDELSLAFLDYRPLARGHCLLIPKQHCDTLLDLPPDSAGPLLRNAQALIRAMERGLGAEGALTIVNVKISQSVPHLHIHLVPRWLKDGLFSRPFFWQRRTQGQGALRETQEAIRAALAEPPV